MSKLAAAFPRYVVFAALLALLIGLTPPAYAIGCDVTALINAIHNASSGSSINLAAGCTYTLTSGYNASGTGLPVINIPLTINGNDAIIERSSAGGTPSFRLVFVDVGGNLTLNHLTLRQGLISFASGAGIYNHGNLTLNNSTVSGNSASVGSGGGIYSSQGTLTLNNSTVSDNSVTLGGGGGIYSSQGTLTANNSAIFNNTTQSSNGGGIYGDNSTLTLSSSTVVGNLAFDNDSNGGGIYGDNSTLTLSSSTFSGDGASVNGGGIDMLGGTLTLTNSTFSGNGTTSGDGGAIYNDGGTAAVSSSTVSGNTATNGGGIRNDGTAAVSNSTFSGNTATSGGGIYNGGTLTVSNSTVSGNSASGNGGGIEAAVGSVKLGSSILAGNSAPTRPDIEGGVTSLGYNVIGDTSGVSITGDTTGNLTGSAASPLNLSALADNGGPTQTMALGAGSVAIGHGNCDSLSGVPRVTGDQRGDPRKSPCDVGAYETQPASDNLLQNGSFTSGLAPWTTFGQITDQVSGGVFQFYRNSGGASAVVLQETFTALPSGAPLTVSLQLGNSSSVRKRAVILVHEFDFTDLQVCSFWIPPHTALRTYQMRTKTTKAWTNATLSVYASPADGLGYILLDNIDYEYHPELDVHETLCIDPGAPPPGAGADGANLIVNGGFSSGLSPWGTFGHITDQIAGGVFKFYKTAGTPSGVVLQNTGIPVAANVPVEAQFQLGNSSAVRMRATILLQAADFSDLQVCTFWIAPNTPLQTYIMRTFSTIAWGGATVSVYPATVAASGWTLLDNVSLLQRPSLFVSGTECYLPDSGVALTAQPVPEIPLGETLPGAVIGSPPPQIPEVGGQTPGEAPQHVAPTDTSGLDAPPPGSQP